LEWSDLGKSTGENLEEKTLRTEPRAFFVSRIQSSRALRNVA